MSTTDIALVVLFVLLFLAAAGFALAEVAILRVPRAQVVVADDNGEPRAGRVLDLIDDLPHVLGTVLLAALLTQVGAATVSGVLASRWVGGIGITVTSVAVTLLLFVYAEAIPKSVAVSSPMRVALWVAPTLALLVRILRPVVAALIRFADLQAPTSVDTARSALTEDELRVVADESALAGEIEPGDVVLLGRSLDFGDLVVRDVFVPRADVVSVAATEPIDDALRLAVHHGHRRLPVHNGQLDETIGVVELRDLAAAVERDESAPTRSLVRDTLEVGPDERVADVLRQMQASGRRFAVVCEHGRVAGIVTIEDIVAELVGEIAADD